MTDRVVLLIVTPLVAAFFCLLEKLFPRLPLARSSSLAAVLLDLSLLAGLLPVLRHAPVVYPVGGWGNTVGIVLRFDGLAWLGSLVVLVVVLSSLLFSFGEGRYDPGFYFFLLVLLAGMEGALQTDDLFNLFVFLEIIGLATYTLIAYAQSGPALLASFKYLVLSSAAVGFYLLGVFIFYQATGSLSLERISTSLPARTGAPGAAGISPSLALGTVALVIGVGVRTAFLPFHAWLPEAHGTAPHPISAVLSGAMIKVAFIVLWRILYALRAAPLSRLFLWIGAATAIWGVILALAQLDSKRLLAYHSVSQMGYILAAFGGGTAFSLTASMYHLASHALFKSLLFLSVGSVILATGEASLRRLRGLWRRLPLVLLPFAAASLSIAGLPPWNGFVSKKLIDAGLAGQPAAPALLWGVSVATAASFIKLSGIFRGGLRRPRPGAWPLFPRARPPSAQRPAPSPELPPRPPGGREPPQPGALQYLPLYLLAALCLATGLFPGFWAEALLDLAGGGGPASLPPIYTPAAVAESLLAALLGLGLFLFVMSPPGQAAMGFVRRLHLGFQATMYFLVAGFAALSALYWWLSR